MGHKLANSAMSKLEEESYHGNPLTLLFVELGGPVPASCLAASVTRLPQALAHFLSSNRRESDSPKHLAPLLPASLFLNFTSPHHLPTILTP